MATKRDSRPHSTTAPGISRVQTQPFASKPDSSPPDARADDPGSEREFDPFRFAVTELPTGMRQELIATKLPVVPAEQLFDTKPPNARLAAPSPVEGPSIPDSLPAVDSGQALAIPVRSNQLLLLGVVALFVFAVALALVLRSGSSTTAVSPPAVPNPEHAKPEPTAQARAVPEQNAEPAESNAASSAAAPSKPIPPASPSEPKAKSSPGQAAAPGHSTSSSEHSQARQAPSTPITDQAAAPPKKESALRSVLAPPPD
jgi:hypothetical protein